MGSGPGCIGTHEAEPAGPAISDACGICIACVGQRKRWMGMAVMGARSVIEGSNTKVKVSPKNTSYCQYRPCFRIVISVYQCNIPKVRKSDSCGQVKMLLRPFWTLIAALGSWRSPSPSHLSILSILKSSVGAVGDLGSWWL